MDFQPPDQGQNPPNSQHSISSQLSNQSSQSTISSSQTTVASSQSTANSSQSTAPPSSQSQSTIPGLLSSPSSRFPVQSSQSSFPRSKNSDPFPGSQDLSQHPSSQIAYSGSQFSPQSSQVSQWPGNVQISSSQGSYGKDGTDHGNNPIDAINDYVINRTDWETYHQAQGGSYSFLLTTLDTRDKTGQDAKEQYHEVRPMILNALRTTQPLGSPWMLTALARKLVPAPGSESFIIPTVYVVCAKPLLLKDSLLELLTLLRIEVHAGSLMFNNDLNWWFPSDRQYEKQVTMGRSIGVHGLGAQGGSGTFGGWVYSPKSGKLFGVTAGHVVLAQKSGKLYSEEELPIMERDMTMMQPSCQDYEHRITVGESLVEEARKDLELTGSSSPRKRQAHEYCAARLAQLALSDKDRVLGRVVLAIHGLVGGPVKQWKDYALIDVVRGKFIHKLHMAGLTHDRAERQGPSKIGAGAHLDGDCIVRGHVQVRESMKVVKAGGRTTGQSAGIVNSIKADVRLGIAFIKGNPLQGKESAEWLVIKDREKLIHKKDPLSTGGDSGSFFVTEDDGVYKVAGMMFRGYRHGEATADVNEISTEQDLTFITAAQDLINWWKQDLDEDLEFGNMIQ